MKRRDREADLWWAHKRNQSMLDTGKLLLLAHFKMTEIYNGGSGISSALIRAVPTTPVISAHTAKTRHILDSNNILL